MNSKHSTLVFLCSVILAMSFYSCNSNTDSQAEKKIDTAINSDTAVIQALVQSFTPFKIFMVRHKVADFIKWKKEYMNYDSLRTVFGITRFMIGRSFDDSNMVIVIDKFADARKAKKFSKLPELNEAMQKAGITSDPYFSLADVIRMDEVKTDQQNRLMITQHVRNFDAWLKAFDAEGKDTRANYGMVDRGLARGIDDPNMVYMVFAISDTAKARARAVSEDLKKLMTIAGVDSKPDIFFYRLTD